jgi:Fur family ferric uptake transcriptional regulator
MNGDGMPGTRKARRPRSAAQKHSGHEGSTTNGTGLSELRRPWNEYLAKRGLNSTATRDLVVDTFLSTIGHVDLPDLLAQVRRRDPGIGLATVYRTIKLMQEAGLADARQFSERGTVYEIAVGREHHDHLICEACGTIVEFSDDQIEALQREIARDLGFELVHHRHELFGLCATCRGSRGEGPKKL